MTKQYYVYVLTNNTDSVLYIGITNNLQRRVWEHNNSFVDSFTSKYKVNKLVYYDILDSSYEAIKREKQLKNWHREWKLNLIKEKNPEFRDLYNELL